MPTMHKFEKHVNL